MKSLIKIAWRNVWRNRRRSLITIAAIGFGLAAFIFTLGFTDGMVDNMIENAIKTYTGHIQIHKAGYQEEQSIALTINNAQKIRSLLDKDKSIIAYTERVKSFGLTGGRESTSGTMLIGIDPEKEPKVTNIHKLLIEGEFLSKGDSNGVLIGKNLAKILGVEIGDELVILTQALDGSLGNDVYFVRGIFDAADPEVNRGIVYLNLSNAKELMVLGGKIHEIAILSNKPDKLQETVSNLKMKIEDSRYKIQTWEELMPAIKQSLQIWVYMEYIFVIIVFIIVALGILNTMDMAILERYNEFGILLAEGMKPVSIILMVIFESIFLGLLSLLAGGILGIALILFFAVKGIDLSSIAQVQQFIIFSPIIYTKLTMRNIILSFTSVFFTSIIVAIFPAIKASTLKPVEAIRHI